MKGLDNPFFTVLGNGCKKWNEEHPDSEYECLYTGPALTSDEAGEVQLVADLIAKGVAGIAISPSNAPAMASMLKEKKPQMPIMTIDADLQPGRTGHPRTRFQIPVIEVVTTTDDSILRYQHRLERSQPILGRVPLFTPNPHHTSAQRCEVRHFWGLRSAPPLRKTAR